MIAPFAPPVEPLQSLWRVSRFLFRPGGAVRLGMAAAGDLAKAAVPWH
jgi:hypothetical protein